MKLVPILTVSTLILLPTNQGMAQGVRVSPDENRIVVPPRTKQERNLGLEGRPPGQVEQPAPDDDEDNTSEVPDENLDDERLPPTSPPGPRQP